MSRRNARIAAMMTLFEDDMRTLFNKAEAAAPLGLGGVEFAAGVVKDGECGEDASFNAGDLEFAAYLAGGAKENLAAIDEILSGLSKNWKLGRMVAIDRAVLRLAAFELKFAAEDKKVSEATAINEAVSIAKIFGTEKSGKFVNGLLSDVIKK